MAKREGARLKESQKPPSSATSGAAGEQLALAVAEAALDKKAIRIEIMDVRGKVDYTDYVVVMSGRSDRQVNAIARGMEEELKHKHGVRCVGVEGLPQGSWVLLDFGDVVAHVFHQDTRGFYDLESLFIDATRVDFDNPQDDGFSFP